MHSTDLVVDEQQYRLIGSGFKDIKCQSCWLLDYYFSPESVLDNASMRESIWCRWGFNQEGPTQSNQIQH